MNKFAKGWRDCQPIQEEAQGFYFNVAALFIAFSLLSIVFALEIAI